ncbi:hypothetical protein EVAR_32625_1 [Eumeta japonica]|uniref:Uncharacterized protein n=1 Tax=Eumeta variegata TaxID=151549 RepID=A0A4C1WHN6_EUMVA|nr:hypothetical protein EVAR_32625_1 [Eumeta japonica]
MDMEKQCKSHAWQHTFQVEKMVDTPFAKSGHYTTASFENQRMVTAKCYVSTCSCGVLEKFAKCVLAAKSSYITTTRPHVPLTDDASAVQSGHRPL